MAREERVLMRARAIMEHLSPLVYRLAFMLSVTICDVFIGSSSFSLLVAVGVDQQCVNVIMENVHRHDHARESGILAPAWRRKLGFAGRPVYFAVRPPLWMHFRKS